GPFFLEGEDHPCYLKAKDLGIEIDEGMMILRRDIFKSGKSVCRVNGKLVTIAALREIGSTLVDIHGQHEHQELMDETKHINLLDQFGAEDISTALNEYQSIFHLYDQKMKKLKHLSENE